MLIFFLKLDSEAVKKINNFQMRKTKYCYISIKLHISIIKWRCFGLLLLLNA